MHQVVYLAAAAAQSLGKLDIQNHLSLQQYKCEDSRTAVPYDLHFFSSFFFILVKYWKTSAVSTTDGWLKLNFASCVMRGTSDTLIWARFCCTPFYKKRKTSAVRTTDVWWKLNFASCVIRQTRSLGAIVLQSICNTWYSIMVFMN